MKKSERLRRWRKHLRENENETQSFDDMEADRGDMEYHMGIDDKLTETEKERA